MAAAPILILGVADLVGRVRPDGRRPEWVQRLAEAAAPFHVVSSYGLFSAMTTERPEIVIEGSDDGEEWREYGFRYKPGDVTRAPRWVAPHQPRLDWQMWFAALGYPPGWFPRFVVRLLEGSPEVLALLERNPFPARPPRFVRALLYDYKMTDLRTHRQTGQLVGAHQAGHLLSSLHVELRSPTVAGRRRSRVRSPYSESPVRSSAFRQRYPASIRNAHATTNVQEASQDLLALGRPRRSRARADPKPSAPHPTTPARRDSASGVALPKAIRPATRSARSTRPVPGAHRPATHRRTRPKLRAIAGTRNIVGLTSPDKK